MEVENGVTHAPLTHVSRVVAITCKREEQNFSFFLLLFQAELENARQTRPRNPSPQSEWKSNNKIFELYFDPGRETLDETPLQFFGVSIFLSLTCPPQCPEQAHRTRELPTIHTHTSNRKNLSSSQLTHRANRTAARRSLFLFSLVHHETPARQD